MERELLENFWRRPATLLYPWEKASPINGMRTRVSWRIERCIGCSLCSQICPTEAVNVEGKGKKWEVTYRLDRCIFCGECVEICPTKTIEASGDYDLVFTEREEMTIRFKNPGTPPSEEGGHDGRS